MATKRRFLQALLYERDGDLNLSWLFVLIMGIVGAGGFVSTVILSHTATVLEKIAAWSFLGATFASVLLSAIPVAKAKILSQSKLPTEIGSLIAGITDNIETSTDLKEIAEKQSPNNSL